MPETCDAAICSGWLLLTLKSVAFTDDGPALMDKITVEFCHTVTWLQHPPSRESPSISLYTRQGDSVIDGE